MAKKNAYKKKAAKQQTLEGFASAHAKGDIKHASLQTGRDVLIGALGGGLAGAALGRASLLAGIAVTGIGHFMGSEGAASFGIGMMASGGYQTIAGMSGTEQDVMDGVKERVMAFKDTLKHKLFLDKIFPATTTQKTETEQTTNGMGEVQYFNYPNGKELEGATDDIDLSALDKLEQRVHESAKKYQAIKTAATPDTNISGTEETNEFGEIDANEMNF